MVGLHTFSNQDYDKNQSFKLKVGLRNVYIQSDSDSEHCHWLTCILFHPKSCSQHIFSVHQNTAREYSQSFCCSATRLLTVVSAFRQHQPWTVQQLQLPAVHPEWLNCVHKLLLQFSCAFGWFQFNDASLVRHGKDLSSRLNGTGRSNQGTQRLKWSVQFSNTDTATLVEGTIYILGQII